MERWQFIRWGIAASVLAHLLIAGGVVVSTTVRPYEIPKSNEIAVDIVDAEEPQKTPEPEPTPSPSASPSPELTLPQPAPQPSPSPSPAASAPPPVPQPSPTMEAKEAPKPASSPSPPPQRPSPKAPAKMAAKSEAKSEAKPEAKQEVRSVLRPMPVQPQSYVPPEPDITVKYGVRLGLPDPLDALPSGGDQEVGSTATKAVAADLEAALRQRFKSCARLPASLSRSDDIFVKLLVAMRPDGRLAAEPELLGGPAVADPEKVAKVIQLKQSALAALDACQPYSMLPPDRYREWQVLEISFRPQDFGG
ncbi:hypothetical protein ACQR0Z_22005 [Bradyrhizobium sp. HKCCYLS3077]|uniref:hypothetical protein n=1 Tax=Bradyrhizobium sp. HKCCYLS3077 TaxID=3420761 RepID=UPI003EBE534C